MSHGVWRFSRKSHQHEKLRKENIIWLLKRNEFCWFSSPTSGLFRENIWSLKLLWWQTQTQTLLLGLVNQRVCYFRAGMGNLLVSGAMETVQIPVVVCALMEFQGCQPVTTQPGWNEDPALENSVAEVYDIIIRAPLIVFNVVKTASKTKEIT